MIYWSRKPKNERGGILFELSMALTVATLMLASGAYWWSRATTEVGLEETYDQIMEVASAAQRTWASQGNYATLTEANIINSGSLPESIVAGNQIKFSITGPGEDVSISGQTSGGIGCNGRANCNNAFHIRLTGLEKNECQVLARASYGPNQFGIGLGPVGGAMTLNLTHTDVATINGICTQNPASGFELRIYFM